MRINHFKDNYLIIGHFSDHPGINLNNNKKLIGKITTIKFSSSNR